MSIGFIILRHVNNEMTNQYWQHCYECIRQYYPEHKIIIIDDNSDESFITYKKMYNTTIIESEYHKRGELLPYYYYLKCKLFDTAVILHDSVFINKHIEFNVDKFKTLWTFKHNWDQHDDETIMISSYNDKQLLDFYNNKNIWNGCFGGMAIIKHDYLKEINCRYDISNLLEFVTSRHNRRSFERVIGCLLDGCLLRMDPREDSLLGDIHDYCNWGITFDEKQNYAHLPIIKVWTGR